MTEIVVVVEGRTEQRFVNDVLSPYLGSKDVHVRARLLGETGHKGGNIGPQRLLKDITGLLRQRRDLVCSTMFDFYGLPGDFPGKSEVRAGMSSQQKALCIENGLADRLCSEMSVGFVPARFLPYVQMHEFEALLFSAPSVLFESLPPWGAPADAFAVISEEYATPEEINDRRDCSPSHRILKANPRYDKASHGPAVAERIGLDCMRRECPHFNAWVTALERLGQNKV